MADQLNLPQIQGPFNLQPPDPSQYYQGSGQQSVSGYGGKKEALAMFADKFLAGVNKGRLISAQRSYEKEQRSLQSLSLAMQQLQQAQIPDDLKQQQMSKLSNAMAQMVAGVGEDGDGKKKTKKGGDQSQDQQENPANHVITAIKGIASSMLGPGAKKQALSREELDALTGDTFGLIGDPGNNSQKQSSAVDQQASQIYKALSVQTGADGKPVPVTMESLLKNPGFQAAMTQSFRLNGNKMSPAIAGIWGEAEANSATQRAQADPAYQEKILRDRAEVEEFHSRAKQYSAQAEKDAATAQTANTYRDNETQQLVRQNPDGTWTNVASWQKVTPSGDMIPLSKLTAGGTRPVFQKQLVGDKKMLLELNPNTNVFEPALDNKGNPIMSDTPLGNAIYMHSRLIDPEKTKQDLININEKYDSKIDEVRKRLSSRNVNKKDADEEISQYEKQRKKELDIANPSPPPPTQPPPKARGAAARQVGYLTGSRINGSPRASNQDATTGRQSKVCV